MGNKTVKWKFGEQMLIKTVMDEEMHEVISNNNYVGPAHAADKKDVFGFSEVFIDRNGIQVRLRTRLLPNGLMLSIRVEYVIDGSQTVSWNGAALAVSGFPALAACATLLPLLTVLKQCFLSFLHQHVKSLFALVLSCC